MLRTILKSLLFLTGLAVFNQPLQSAASAAWWKEVVFYQIYMPSFQDSDGNGISDFAGMHE